MEADFEYPKVSKTLFISMNTSKSPPAISIDIAKFSYCSPASFPSKRIPVKKLLENQNRLYPVLDIMLRRTTISLPGAAVSISKISLPPLTNYVPSKLKEQSWIYPRHKLLHINTEHFGSSKFLWWKIIYLKWSSKLGCAKWAVFFNFHSEVMQLIGVF